MGEDREEEEDEEEETGISDRDPKKEINLTLWSHFL